MHLAQEPEADRQVSDALEARLKSRHVVRNLTNVRTFSLRFTSCFKQEQVRERGERTFDPARKYGLFIHERPDQQMGIRQRCSHAGEIAQGALCVRYRTS